MYYHIRDPFYEKIYSKNPGAVARVVKQYYFAIFSNRETLETR